MNPNKKRLRRSMMFLNCQKPGLIKDPYVYGPDSIMLDLEDAVAEKEKDAARYSLFHALREIDYRGVERVVRINGLDTDLWEEDIRCSVAGGCDAIRIPKTETAGDVHRVESAMAAAEEEFGVEPGRTLIMAALESARGVMNTMEICLASERLFGIALSGGDYTKDLQTTISGTGVELMGARQHMIIAARAAGVQCFDTVWTNLDDMEGFRRDVETIHAMAPLAAGGGAVVTVVLVLCMVGALLLSPLGVLFSGEASGSSALSDAIQEINQKFDAKLEELKSASTYDELSLSVTRAPWREVLAVYAVKTISDPANGQEVVTMNDEKKELLKQVFWDMNELSSFTSTVPGEGDEADTTTLYITVVAKTTDEMADLYGFTASQRQQLAELLSDEHRELWSAALGFGTGDGEIVAVALSQVGNIGGQPYWSWYGFSYRVDWCAIFVSWCADQCGYIDTGVMPKFAGCVQGSQWFKDRGRWQDHSYTPNAGDVIFFDWDNPGGFSGPQDGVPDHVGIVERVENGRVYTVEGNSGDKCVQRSYPVGYYEIWGYGCPIYNEASDSQYSSGQP